MDWTVKCDVCQKRMKKNLFVGHLNEHRQRGDITEDKFVSIR